MTKDELNEALAFSRDIETLKAIFDEQHKGHWVAITTADKKIVEKQFQSQYMRNKFMFFVNDSLVELQKNSMNYKLGT